jgi:hypothetical protein
MIAEKYHDAFPASWLYDKCGLVLDASTDRLEG